MSAIEMAFAESQKAIGREIGLSDWVLLNQARIDAFAAATLDRQWIHTAPEKAANTAFGGTIAHGFLTLSLAAHFAQTALPPSKGAVMSVNYGFDRIRFLAPVRSGARIRGRFILEQAVKRKPLELLRTYALSIEIEGMQTPAVKATWLGLTIFDD
ncbi:MaoC family dehydratase [Loktanella sp. S4079]|uniref:MaoC family dehydratase n=1 Tax=Loktanella sp. S4079 TaxID=579483 RepID=UPI0005FA32A3|nr:MaoC family dehydratase [Loktanella sp. S4079]KJZ18434.1 hypothetical protein TW80_13345 [Loktanella sp. S4079]